MNEADELMVFVFERPDGFYWYLIGEYNDHVLAQGRAKTEKTAYKYGQQAQIDYLAFVS